MLHRQDDPNELRVDSPTFQAELPLVINPELHRPEAHFIFAPDGSIAARSNQAKTTIAVCGLDRETLVLARKKKADYFKKRLRKALRDRIEGKINEDTFKYILKGIFSKALTDASSPEVPYAMLSRFLFRFFEPFFIDPLGAKSREVVRKAFRRFLEGKL